MGWGGVVEIKKDDEIGVILWFKWIKTSSPAGVGEHTDLSGGRAQATLIPGPEKLRSGISTCKALGWEDACYIQRISFYDDAARMQRQTCLVF